MSEIEKGSKRKLFIKRLTHSLSEFWTGWFGDIINISNLFESIETKESNKIAYYIIIISSLHSIIHSYLIEDWGWWSLAAPIYVCFALVMSGMIFIFLPFLIIQYTTCTFYRIIYHRDLKIKKTINKVDSFLENLFEIRMVAYLISLIIFVFINYYIYFGTDFFGKLNLWG